MTLDIRGSLKNTRINTNYYVVIDELLSNAIDSYLIRKDAEANAPSFEVYFSIELFNKDLAGQSHDLKISCTDNGAGLGDEQMKAFVTKDTSYKDDLKISGIGQCKGSGRIQFLHYFSKLKIQSTFFSGGEYKLRSLNVDASKKEIDEDSFQTSASEDQVMKTTITLDVIKPEVYEKIFLGKNLYAEFSPEALKSHVLIACLQRLVSLKERLGEFSIKFETTLGENSSESELTLEELPIPTSEEPIKIYYHDTDGNTLSNFENFTITHYQLDKDQYNLKSNTIALCAKSSIVENITKRYLKTKTLENNPVNNHYHIILVESQYLNENVNEQRDAFNLPIERAEESSFLSSMLSFSEIYAEVDDVIIRMIEPPDWDRQDIVRNVQNRYGISSEMISEANVRITYGDTEEKVVKRVLSSYQDKIIKDTSEIFDIREKIENSDPTSDEFREKINELAWKYTSSLKSVDMANLSQLVVRRAAILEILELAINTNLNIQNLPEGARRKDEEIIHNIFFPMRTDSRESEDHDIWILNEEYQYFDYIASDIALSKITWEDGSHLFSKDIDDELSKILQANYQSNKSKRPDTAIFSKEGSAIIIEFKAPNVSMDDHIGDLMEYSQLLAAKSNGRLKKFYGYLIGKTVNANRLTGYKRFPTGKGWFNTTEIIEPSSGQRLGELYSEILHYDDVVERANKRLEVYKKRLNLKT